MKNFIIMAAVTLLNTQISLASGGKAAATAKAPYGMAGCGFGALVIEKNELLPQIGAWFLNGIIANQTYAISSGTSNCVESRTATAAMEQEVFIAANLSSLSKEAAQGEGQHLEGLAEVFGCHGDLERLRLSHLSQENHSKIFADVEPSAVVRNYLSTIQGDAILGKHCLKAS